MDLFLSFFVSQRFVLTAKILYGNINFQWHLLLHSMFFQLRPVDAVGRIFGLVNNFLTCLM